MHGNIAKNAFLIIGWNSRAKKLISEFAGALAAGLDTKPVVVLTEENSTEAELNGAEAGGVTIVAGNPLDKKVLEKIGAHNARSVIVLSDSRKRLDHDGHNVHDDPDARTALIVLAIRSLGSNDRPRIICEVHDPEKIDLVTQAGANDAVCHAHYGIGALAQSAMFAEASKVYRNFFSYGKETCEFYFLASGRDHGGVTASISDHVWRDLFQGRAFRDVAASFQGADASSNPIILVGYQRAGEVILNPRREVTLQHGDMLIVIAYDRPTESDIRHLRKREADSLAS